jgi:hypothetical protein
MMTASATAFLLVQSLSAPDDFYTPRSKFPFAECSQALITYLSVVETSGSIELRVGDECLPSLFLGSLIIKLGIQ